MKLHARRLASERNIAVQYLSLSSQHPKGHVDLLQRLKDIQQELQQLNQNRNIDIQGVTDLIANTFTATEDAIGTRLHLNGLLERADRSERTIGDSLAERDRDLYGATREERDAPRRGPEDRDDRSTRDDFGGPVTISDRETTANRHKCLTAITEITFPQAAARCVSSSAPAS
jgi:hypothetical protein